MSEKPKKKGGVGVSPDKEEINNVKHCIEVKQDKAREVFNIFCDKK